MGEVSTLFRLPPPLWGRVGERGSHELKSLPEPPPSLALPHKGGGNGAECAATLLPMIESPPHEASVSVGSIDSSEAATALSFPPPLWALWGRGREGGSHELRPLPEPPPCLALPHKGGGNGAERVASLLPVIESVSHHNASVFAGPIDSSEAATALSFPPPLWGRGREGGSHELRLRSEPPLSLTLPHKGGGNRAEYVARSHFKTTRGRSTPC
jgi:hypothetical protein